MRIFAIGDIHGCAKELDELLHVIFNAEGFNAAEDQLLFIGDYVDRGPNTKGVIDQLIKIQTHFPNTVFLRGNHEDMLLNYLGLGGNYGSVFIMNGGDITLLSYFTNTLPNFRNLERREFDHEIRNLLDELNPPPYKGLAEMIPQEHLDFLKNTKRYYDTPIATFVHAGVNPKQTLEEHTDFTLFWVDDNRDGFFCRIKNKPWHKMLIHGHTPIRACEVKEDIDLNRINIDTGFVYGEKYGDAGYLTCLVVDDTQEPKDWKIIQHEGDRIAWRV